MEKNIETVEMKISSVVDIKINGEKKIANAITPIQVKKLGLERIGEKFGMIFFKDSNENYFVLFS